MARLPKGSFHFWKKARREQRVKGRLFSLWGSGMHSPFQVTKKKKTGFF